MVHGWWGNLPHPSLGLIFHLTGYNITYYGAVYYENKTKDGTCEHNRFNKVWMEGSHVWYKRY